MRGIKRVLIAAPRSGSGKTIITCGLLRLLMNQDLEVGSFKCGPDFIDPMFHRSVVGVPSDNLDPFFCDGEMLRHLLSRREGKYVVMEGAMGIYDGISGQGKRGSCYEVAVETKTPIILVVDAKGVGSTISSIIKGILLDDEEKLIEGIILNRASQTYLTSVKEDIEKAIIFSKSKAKLIGAIPNEASLNLESRHLGLKLPEEIKDLSNQVDVFAKAILENCEMDSILEIMNGAKPLESVHYEEEIREKHSRNAGTLLLAELKDENEEAKLSNKENESLKLAVARDEAFCFYYEENIRLLQESGIEIVEFSPLKDPRLPERISGLLIGGGYPELYLDQLSENASIREEILKAIKSGIPLLAECGGFMYLLEGICDSEDEENPKPMVGAIRGSARNTEKLSRFGYIELSSSEDGLLNFGERIKGHEFHYYDSNNNGESFKAEKANGSKSWRCCHMNKNSILGYPHLYYLSNPKIVENFRNAMKDYNLTTNG